METIDIIAIVCLIISFIGIIGLSFFYYYQIKWKKSQKAMTTKNVDPRISRFIMRSFKGYLSFFVLFLSIVVFLFSIAVLAG